MDTPTKAAIRSLVAPSARNGGTLDHNAPLALVLKSMKALGHDAYQYALTVAAEERKYQSVQAGWWQRKWADKVSRRPQRGNHHDSWAIREKYVRCAPDYACYQRYSDSILMDHPAWEIVAPVRYPMRKDRI